MRIFIFSILFKYLLTSISANSILRERSSIICNSRESTATIPYDELIPINLDLDVLQLKREEERYIEDINEKIVYLSNDNLAATTYDSSNGGLSSVTKYESTGWDYFDSMKMNYFLGRKPNSIIGFKESRTVLIPEVRQVENEEAQILNKDGKYYFEEYDFRGLVKYNPEPVLFPATACLKFNCNGKQGSISLAYNIGILISPYAKLQVGISLPSLPNNITIALNYALQYKITKATTYSGTHTCSNKNGQSVRLFYKIGTALVELSKRKVIYDKLDGSFEFDNWTRLGSLKYLADTPPIYYCITDDEMDLRCDEPDVDYLDNEGYLISSLSES